jgi:hypothetical protein
LKALSFAAGPAEGYYSQDYDFTTFPEVVASSQDAYQQAGIKNPREEVSMAEVHDCCTPTELVLMEDMGFSPRGQGWKDVLDGRFDGDGPQPVNPDGGHDVRDVRDVAPAARRGGSAADQGPEARPHAQPGRRAGAVCELRVDRRGVKSGVHPPYALPHARVVHGTYSA